MLAELVAPMPVPDFLAEVWGNGYRLFEGAAGRFADLLAWPALNEILRHHRLEPPRLRLSLDGQMVPADTYTTPVRLRRGGTYPRLRMGALTEHLRNGATLVLDAVDELHDPIDALAGGLEQELREHVQVNAYGSWGSTHGFDLHWDDHDVLVIQVAGRKRWQIWGPTRRWPLFRDIEPNTTPPEKPLTEFMLTDGDVLSIPRGRWHIATAVDEPSLHLTAGITQDTGIDLLTWWVDELRADERLRRDLPRFADRQTQGAHMKELMQAMRDRWDEDLLRRFFDAQDALAPPRARPSLPWGATPELLPSGDDVRLYLLMPRAVLHTDDDTTSLAADGQRWTFTRAAEPLLGVLMTGEPLRIAELYAHADQLEPATVRAFCGQLVAQGIAAVA